MPTDWSLALQVGLVGFGLVFVILAVLYLALALTGWLSAKFSPVTAKTPEKQAAPAQSDKKTSITE